MNYLERQANTIIIELAINGEISKLLKEQFRDKFNQDINNKTIIEFKNNNDE